MSSSEYKAYIEELRHMVTVSGLNHEIWWVYKGEQTRPVHIDVLNRYPLFFQTSIHAHFVALVVSLYKLYETRKDTFNIPQLLKLLETDGAVAPTEMSKLKSKCEEIKPIWLKVGVLRNKVFGHSSKAHTSQEAFTEAGVTPNELRDLLEHTKTLLNDLTRTLERSSHAFNLGAQQDLLNLLNDLKR